MRSHLAVVIPVWACLPALLSSLAHAQNSPNRVEWSQAGPSPTAATGSPTGSPSSPPPAYGPLRVEAVITGIVAEPFHGAQSLGDWGYGLWWATGVGWRGFPVAIGFDITYAKWGTSTSQMELHVDDMHLLLRERRTDHSIFINTWARIQPPYWWIRPYLEGIAGVHMLSSEYSFAFVGGTGETSAVTEKFNTYSIGWGAGVDILLARGTDQPDSGLYARLGFRKLTGGVGTFSRAVDEHSPNRVVEFSLPTDTTVVSLGIAFTAHVREAR